MAVAFRDVGTTNTSNSATLSMGKPAGVVSGDLLLACISYSTNVGQQTITPVDSWTVVQHIYSAAFIHGLTVYRRAAGGSEPANYDFGFSSTPDAVGAVLAYSGHDTTTPINTSATNNSIAAGTLLAAPSVTPSVDNCMVIACFGFDSNGDKGPASPDSSPAATERVEGRYAAGNVHLYVEEYLQSTAAAVALEVTYSSSTLDNPRAISLAIAPAAPTGPTPPYVSISVA